MAERNKTMRNSFHCKWTSSSSSSSSSPPVSMSTSMLAAAAVLQVGGRCRYRHDGDYHYDDKTRQAEQKGSSSSSPSSPALQSSLSPPLSSSDFHHRHDQEGCRLHSTNLPEDEEEQQQYYHPRKFHGKHCHFGHNHLHYRWTTSCFLPFSHGLMIVMMVFLHNVVLTSISASASSVSVQNGQGQIRLGLINGGSSFFEPVPEGWNHACARMSQQRQHHHHHDDIVSSSSTTTTSTALVPTTTSLSNETITNSTQNSSTNITGSANGSSFVDGLETESRPSVQAVECFVAQPKVDVNDTCEAKLEYVKSWIVNDGVHGIAMKPCGDDEIFEEVMGWAWEYHRVPFVLFDKDVDFPQNSSRVAYVGTDQEFLGRTMARLLKQHRPEGGTYGLVGLKDGRVEGFETEMQRDNDRDDRAHWTHVEPRMIETEGIGCFPFNCGDSMSYMQLYADHNVTALVAFKQSPMKEENWTSFVEQYRDRITFLGTDGNEWQIDYLNQKLVDGLVGQLPWSIGQESAERLVEAIETMRSHPGGSLSTAVHEQSEIELHPSNLLPQDTYTTNLVAYNVIPNDLPDFTTDQNLLKGWKVVAPTVFGLICLSILYCTGWTVRQTYLRSHAQQCTITTPSQERLLIITAFGLLVLSASLIPMSWDDNGNPDDVSPTMAVGICMSRPWLVVIGFDISLVSLMYLAYGYQTLKDSAAGVPSSQHTTFGRLFSHKWVPHILASVFMVTTIILLTIWTVLDPMIYRRNIDSATDLWNREISSSGYCVPSSGTGDIVAKTFIPVLILSLIAVIIACWQAISIRNVRVGNELLQLNDPRELGFAIGVFGQTFFTGIPLLVVVRKTPLALYLVSTILVFLLSTFSVSLVFIPKILAQRRYSKLTKKELRILAMLTKQQNSEGDFDESTGLQASFTVATPSSRNMKKEECRPDVNDSEVESEKLEKMRQPLEESSITHVHSNHLSEIEHRSTAKKIATNHTGHEESANEMFRKAISLAPSSGSTEKTSLADFFQKVDKSKLTETERNELETLLALLGKQ